MTTPTNVYVLLLEGGHYYIGCTTNVQKRFQEHKNGQGSSWTHKYHPKKIIECKLGGYIEENALTKSYMIKYGIKNVRGGSYCNIFMNVYEKKILEKELQSIKGACYMCGDIGHYANVCPKKMCSRCKHKNHSTSLCTSVYCYRCGRTSHTSEKCYAKTHISSGSMHNCYRCGRKNHTQKECNQATDIFGVPLSGLSIFGRFITWVKTWTP